MDENDLTDAELAAMWSEASPVALDVHPPVSAWVIGGGGQHTESAVKVAFTLNTGIALASLRHAPNRPAIAAGR